MLLPPSLGSLGLWIEQLVAESTGKHGKGALPVVDEPLGRPDEYGSDRAFVAIATDKRRTSTAHASPALEEAGHPVMRLSTRLDGTRRRVLPLGVRHRGGRRRLGINPFDEPNVSEAKEKTKALLGSLDVSGRLAGRAATSSSDSVEVFSQRFTGGSPAEVVRAALATLAPPDYVAFLSYLPPDSGSRRRWPGFAAACGRAITSPAPSASARVTSTRPGSITRVARTRRSPSS